MLSWSWIPRWLKSDPSPIQVLGWFKPDPSPIRTLRKTLDMLEDQQKMLRKKIPTQMEQAEHLHRENNQRAVIQCLYRKKLYEGQVEQLEDLKSCIHYQILRLEAVKAITHTVDAVRTTAAVIEKLEQEKNIDDVDKIIHGINEHTKKIRHTHNALTTPIRAPVDFEDFDEMNDIQLVELEGAQVKFEFLHTSTIS